MAAFYALGYFPTVLLRLAQTPLAPPSASLALAACLIIPYGGKARSMRRALWRGASYGTIAGVGIWSALRFGGAPSNGADYAAVYIGATAGVLTGVAALFHHLTQKRLRELEQQW
ncbi:MAG: hypothetical protein KGY99_05885 [Phycisphaerae bacterium]|nr:hypothetical protein [Phycisphaerae bacterium]